MEPGADALPVVEELRVGLSVEDRLAVHELVALHGHLMDSGEFGRMDELFCADVVYDVSAFGRGELRGYEAISEASLALGDANPVGHHVTNICVSEDPDGMVRVRSKAIGIYADGRAGSVVYEDVVRREAAGWRIAYRKVVPRRCAPEPVGSTVVADLWSVAGSRRSDPSEFEVGYVDPDEGEVRRLFADVLGVAFERVPPVRSFPSYKGQRNYPGLYWSASVGGHVGVESWLERDEAMALDFDATVTSFAPQPFWLLLARRWPGSFACAGLFRAAGGWVRGGGRLPTSAADQAT